ncbi:DNA-directed RNA polymerase III, subunit Rpc31 [Aspergillus sergii]|uniref:DNA-directed RNA polymerase III subunit n=1 Tax=Aspergillus sergii TaxID=1034303 RepID=A0A5N6X9I6_9EURO|nr:DNA-directed RNA polymerase III, subunit Rpc31 [Aspergillus sergii]
MSRFGAKKGRKLPGAEFTWDNDPNGEPDTAPTPLYPKYTIPQARPLSEREQKQVDLYRALREQFHDGPYYSVLDPGLSGRKSKEARQHFDPFHGMPSYSGKYQKKKRAIPKLSGRPYIMKFFPRDDLWGVIQPNFKAGAAVDGFVAQMVRPPLKRGFEDDEEEDEDIGKRRKTGDEDDEGGENDDLLEPDDEQAEEEIMDDDFEDDDDEMGGDYNAEQYFDGGDDEYGDDGFGDGGGGGDEDTY